MQKRVMRNTVLVVLSVVCLLSWGCRSKPKVAGGYADGDLLHPELLDGDILLGTRFEEGIPVTDVSFANVLFGFDSFQVPPSEVRKVEAVAEYMRRNRDVKLIVEGHCDERGSREYNMSLGEHRALAIRAYLVGVGIDGARIQTRSFGKEKPLNPAHNEAAWRENRRGEFKLFR